MIGIDDREEPQMPLDEEAKDTKKKQKVHKTFIHFEGDDIDIFDINRIEKVERAHPDFNDPEILDEHRPDDPIQYGVLIRFNSPPFAKEYWMRTQNRRDGLWFDLRERLSEKGIKFM